MDNKAKFGLAALGGIFVGANAGKIVKGISLGLIAILIAMLLIVSSVNGVQENSKTVDSLELQSIDDVGDERGLIKAYGQISTPVPTSVEIYTCPDQFCFNSKRELAETDLIYTRVELQRFEVQREVDEEKESGSSTTETVSYTHSWVTKSVDEKWVDLKFGEVEIEPSKARIIIDKESKEIEDAYIADLTPIETFGRTPDTDEPQFGTTRALVTYITHDDREYTVVGEMRSNGISSGNPFIITDKSDTALTEQLGGEESTSRWLMRFGAFLLLTFGLTSMLSPILTFTDMIPLAGKAARGAATLVSAIIAGIIVLTTVFLLNFWWLILIVIVGGIMIFGWITLQRMNTVKK